MAALLCAIAHPDDELFCSGLILNLVSCQVSVHLVCLTRGEGGSLGDPPAAGREEIGRVREGELRCSARALGVDSVSFLGFQDPVPQGSLEAPPHNREKLERALIEAIERHAPDAVLTHGSNGEYGHPAHILLHAAVKSALVKMASGAPALYSFCAAFRDSSGTAIMNRADRAHIVMDISRYFDKRIAAFRCHRTQWATLLGGSEPSPEAYAEAISKYVQARSKEAYRRHLPPINAEDSDPLSAWLALPGRSGALRKHLDAFRDEGHRYEWFLRRGVKNLLRRTS